jgi:hypothetical protein
MSLSRGWEQRSVAKRCALSREVQMRFERIFPEGHRLVLVNVNFKRILCDRA